jgi:hypothetical protein
LLDVLQVKPLLGRSFRHDDVIRGHENVTVLTYNLWQNLFHGASDVIGKTVRLADAPYQVIGVLPQNF